MPHKLRIFGGLALLGPDGEPIDVLQAHSKGNAVLVYLATRPPGEAVSREELLPLLWPDRPEEQGRNALRVALSRLRGDLPDGALGGKGEDRLWVEESVLTSDVRRFEEAFEEGRHREALELYRAPFLEHSGGPDVAPFRRWVDQRRSTYRRRAYEAALVLGREAEKAGDFEEAEDAYRRGLDLSPLKEEAALGLLEVLGKRGKRADALQFYEAFRQRLEEELELSPSEELEERAERVRSGSADAQSPGSYGEKATGAGRDAGEERRDGPWWGSPGRLVAVLVAGLVVAALWLGVGDGGLAPDDGRQAAASDGGVGPTVAVLPFENLSRSEEARPFVRGLHFEVLTRLSNVDGLAVMSRSSVGPYRDTEMALSAVADSLGVEWILEGGVQQSGDRIQVNAQLIDPDTDTHAWAASYRRELTARNLFGIQEELTQKIVRAVDVELTPEDERQVTSVPTENTAAYELYLQARRISQVYPEQRITEEEREQSIRLYRRALELDSTFADAWAGLADSYVQRAWEQGWERAWADSARRAARRALQLNPDLAYAYAQLGDAYLALGKTERQLEAYRRAWELKPDPAMAHNLIVFLRSRGRYAEKLKWLDRIVATSPESPGNVRKLVATNVLLGRDSVAEAWRRYARDREISLAEVEFAIALLYHADLDRARALLDSLAGRERALPQKQRRAALALYEGDWKQAYRLYRQLSSASVGGLGRDNGLFADRLGLAWSLARLGQRTEAEHIAEQVRADARDDIEGNTPGSGVRNRLAVAHLLLGDTVRALEWLEKAAEAGGRNAPLMESVPTLAPLREHPRFQALLGRLRGLLAEERRQAEKNGWGEPPERVAAGG